MIRSYSQRILPPFSGVVQIAESDRARALSFDAITWEIQYLPGSNSSDDNRRVRGYGLNRSYYDVASLYKDELSMFVFPSCIDHDEISESILELSEFLSTAQVPFPAADNFEYWLLDATDDSPLALIYSCCDESLIGTYPGQTEWIALPHSKMNIANTEGERARNEPPVNHRFQRMIASRAGRNPRAAWFRRDQDNCDAFPSLLVREDWHNETDYDLCQRYLMRKAPRLLMLHGLPYDDRERLEVAAKSHVFEIEQYFTMYPEVNDQRRLSAMRVEAQIRRTAPRTSGVKAKKKSSTDSSLSKDMRIFET